MQNKSYLLKIRGGVEVDSAGKKAGKGPLIAEEISNTLGTSQDQYLFQAVEEKSKAIGFMRGLGGVQTMNEKMPTHQAANGMSGNNKPCVAYGVTTKGNGDAFVSEERHTSLSTGGGEAGQGYPCVMTAVGVDCYNLILDDQGGQQISVRTGCLLQDPIGALCARDYKGVGNQFVEEGKIIMEENYYIVRRLTPLECNRLQGFPDGWGEIDHKEDFTEEEYQFWLDVRNTWAAINGRQVKDYTKEQMLKWYNKLHTDSAEYKMWGNGIGLPNALYVMKGIAESEKRKHESEE